MSKKGKPTIARTGHNTAFPWSVKTSLARQGDADSLCQLCAEAKPLIETVCRIPKYINLFGRDEVRSIISLKLIEFLLDEKKNYPDEAMPAVLKTAMREALIDHYRKLEVRRSHEVTDAILQADAPAAIGSLPDLIPDNRTAGPEEQLLRGDLRRNVREAVQQLRPNEQTVIRGLFFRHKNTVELARELHCTSQNVGYIKRVALTRLGHMLKSRLG